MAAKGMFKFPNISRLFQQLSRYRLPDKDLSQDMVAAFLVCLRMAGKRVLYRSKGL